MLAPHMPTNTEVAHLDFHGNPQGRTVQLISPPTTHCKLGKLSTQVWGPAGQDCARTFCPRAKGPQKLRRNTKMRVVLAACYIKKHSSICYAATVGREIARSYDREVTKKENFTTRLVLKKTD